MCEYDYNWILDDLALGNIVVGKNLDYLKSIGIDVIVCALPELPLPIEAYEAKGFSLLHIPIDDAESVDIGRWFEDVTYFIMMHRLMNRKTFVHCYAGISRSSTLLCSYLMNLFCWDEVKALFWIRDKRPCVSPNSGFLRQLKQYSHTNKHCNKRLT